MRIAILGATSQIAKDLIKSMSEAGSHELYLYARQPKMVHLPSSAKARATIIHNGDYASFGTSIKFDALINFIGVGNPAATAKMGADIFDITIQFDQLALGYIRAHPNCRYIFLSSGSVYGSDFLQPASRETAAIIKINSLSQQDWYGAAKLHAECRHRSYADLSIIDVRVFNYFSATQDLDSEFLICDIIRSIANRKTLRTTARNIVRDYLNPIDFHGLIEAILKYHPKNDAVDCYSLSPIDKFTLLKVMKNNFGLDFELTEDSVGINSTGIKQNYFSLSNYAAEFGYQPTLTSMEGVLREASIILNKHLENPCKIR
jgi:nucleoside-diphosphate-sugar epimerase